MVREKRSYTRIALNIPANIFLYHMEFRQNGVIANISLSGCFFPFTGELPIGEPCAVAITVGEGLQTETVSLSGTIVRCDAEGAGINFTKYSPALRLQLKKIISHESAKHHSS